MLGISSGEQPESIAVRGPEGSESGKSSRSRKALMIPPISPLGIKCMSMDLLIKNQNDALVWRGPMIQKVGPRPKSKWFVPQR